MPADKFGEHPIKIDAENTSVENGVALAVGNATLRYQGVRIAADTIRYFPATRMVIAQGNVDFTDENGNRITGADAIVEYVLQTKKFKVFGKHKSVLKDMGEPK